MKYVAMIQARCGSSRLPNKVLTDLCGKTALERTIARVQQSRYVDETMVITSINRENLAIVKLCSELGIRVFVGSEDDVLDRYYQAAKLLQPEYVIRVTGDCPLYDPALLDQAIEQMEADTDYVAQLGKETYPDGLDIEIFRFEALQRSWEDARLPSEREHVTQYIRKHPELFKQQNILCPYGDCGHERWTLDEPEDLKLIAAIYQHFSDIRRTDFSTGDVLAFLDENPELRALNSQFARNEGLAKSLEKETISAAATDVFLESERLLLKPLTVAYATDEYAAWMNDYETVKYTESRFAHHSIASLKDFISHANNATNYTFAIIERSSNKHIGNIKLGSINYDHRYCDIGLIIGDNAKRGKGYASEAITLCTEFAFQTLHLRLVFAGIYAPNIASQKAFRKAGYTESFVMPNRRLFEDKYVDCIIMEKRKEDTNKIKSIDEKNLITRLSAQQYLASIKGDNYVSYRKDWAYYGQNQVVPAIPLQLNLEITGKCNLRCKMCYRNYDIDIWNDSLSLSDIENLVQQFNQLNIPSLWISGGEPLMHPQIHDVLRALAKANALDFWLVTNGLLLDETLANELIDCGLTWLSVSIDAATKETYSKIRGGNYDTLLQNIETFLKVRERRNSSTPFLRVTLVKMPENKDEEELFAAQWQDKADIIDLQQESNYKDLDKISDDSVRNATFRCTAPYTLFSVNSKGCIYPCCNGFIRDNNRFTIRNITLAEFWNSSYHTAFAKSVKDKNYCKECMECVKSYMPR